VFAAGAGWPRERRTRVKEIVIRHMWDEVDPAIDAEGHLLCEGTGLDISGRGPDRWPAAFQDQARRKPGCAAAAAVAGGMAGRVAANPLDAEPPARGQD
jgi:hypothetical protein